MATRTPTSILFLIDRRNRLEGELERLAALKRAASDLHRHVKKELDAFSAALDQHAGRFDEARVRTSHSLRSCAHSDYGLLTRLIIRSLKEADGRPLTSTEIRLWVEAHWPAGGDDPSDAKEWARNVRRRLRNLRVKGVLLSPAVGTGAKTRTTWMINPAMLIQGLDTESTLFDDDDLGSSRRTTGTDHTDESD